MIRTLQSKITLTYIGLSFLVLVLAGFLSSYEVERYFLDRLATQLRSESSVLHAYLREVATLQTPRESSVRTLAAIAATTNMRITLVDREGRVLYESSVPDAQRMEIENHGDRPEIVRARIEGLGASTRFSTTMNLEMMYVARLVDYATFEGSAFEGLQVIRVGLPAEEAFQYIRDIRIKVLVAGLLVFLLVIVVSRSISRQVASPLNEIGSVVREIKGGNLDRKLPVRGDDEIGRLAELINEMTETLKRDIEQLRKLERVRSEFLGNVSHELRTPIFSLQGFLETLLDGAIDDPRVNRTFIERAYHQANRLDTLLADLIEISRIESGEMKMSFRYFELREFLNQLEGDFREAATRNGQTLVLEPTIPTVAVYGDRDRLRQAMSNIVENALKYSGQGTTIRISAREVDGHVELTIRDNGVGIAQEHLPRIFERFYRVDKDRSREVGGTGLGLAIVKHIIEAHGGRIRVESTPGAGTMFTFDLRK
jgi:two-component system phosphate regulon sensor histidine kinase PhoR